MHKIFIDGQAGTTGLKIHSYLQCRADLVVLEVAKADRKNESVKQDLVNAADIVILCLPDEAAKQTVGLASNARTRIIDASTAFRVDPAWVYGLPELAGQRDRIRAAQLVSNPGCYATGFLLAIAPLTSGEFLDANIPLSISAVSGYTGGGRPMIERYEARAVEHPDALWYSRPYALRLEHKHVPEMHKHAGLVHAPMFLPSVGHYPQGMLVSTPLSSTWFTRRLTLDDIVQVLRDYYTGEPCVVVHDANDESALEFGQLEPQANNETNRVDLFVFGNVDRVLLIARLDNLGKGAAGAAVQNLNLMLGIDEFMGLRV